MDDGKLEALGQTIARGLAGAVTGFAVTNHELTVSAKAERIVDVVKFLRDNPDCRFISFIDVTAVDDPARDPRFEVVYHFLSPHKNTRVRIKVPASESTLVPSITGLFPGADWFEREAFDFYGISFTGHPDLRRILTDYGFDGHPLRKDFPQTGYVEVRYDDEKKRVVYEPVRLNQEFRKFDFLSPWEGADYPLPGDEKAKG
ncbi:MAG: NADH-quinone oxidoreductase subunit C [Xanthobacteraceae bacterium]|nr:MAG: NADH-quinone oxidoreductase subunit C [Xanthobacteraceae bacterium]